MVTLVRTLRRFGVLLNLKDRPPIPIKNQEIGDALKITGI
jgi:hypothetical protein